MMIEDIGIASYGALGQIFSLWKFDQLILKKIIITVATSLQISDFKAKMHQIPTSAGGAYRLFKHICVCDLGLQHIMTVCFLASGISTLTHSLPQMPQLLAAPFHEPLPLLSPFGPCFTCPSLVKILATPLIEDIQLQASSLCVFYLFTFSKIWTLQWWVWTPKPSL